MPLLESTYNFLWPFIHGIAVEKPEKDFLIRACLCAPDAGSLVKRLNSFLRIQAKSVRTEYIPSATLKNYGIPPDTFIIVPSPAAHIPPSGIPIFIQRGRSFGIGSHPCTVYCLRALQDILATDFQKKRIRAVLDAGAGTGILSIAAARMGASQITGVEIVSDAVMEAVENIRLNSMEAQIRILHGSVTETAGRYDLVLANLYGVLLKEIAAPLAQKVSPGGFIVLGGMTVAQIESVVSAYRQSGLKEYRRYADDEWGVAVLQR